MTIAPDLQIFATPIDQLHLMEGNPRQGDVKVIEGSLAQFGQRTPIVYRTEPDPDSGEPRKVVYAGNHRLLAATNLGWDEIAAVSGDDLTHDQIRAFSLADNRTGDLGEYDDNLLTALLDDLRDDTELLAATGYDDDALGELLDDWNVDPIDPDTVDDIPDIPEGDPITKTGDVWQLGPHTLICGDSTDKANYPQQEQVALLVTDPPYGVSYADKNTFLNNQDEGNRIQREIENDHLSPEEVKQLWDQTLQLCHEALTPGGVYYVTGPQGGDLLLLLLESIKGSGLILKHMLMWSKNNHVLGRCDYNYKHEPIIYGWKGGAGHKFYGDGSNNSVWEIDKPQSSKLHPTMKPVELYQRAIRNSSLPGEIVLEPFAGSGTGVIACEQTGRVCHAIELDPHYVDVICTRYQNATGTLPILQSTNEPHNFLNDETEPNS